MKKRNWAVLFSIAFIGLGFTGAEAAEAPPNRMSYYDLVGGTSSFLAKEMCSCLWVMKRSERFCVEYTKQSPSLSKYRIDRAAKKVYTGLKKASVAGYGLFPRTAKFVDDKRGCVLTN